MKALFLLALLAGCATNQGGININVSNTQPKLFEPFSVGATYGNVKIEMLAMNIDGGLSVFLNDHANACKGGGRSGSLMWNDTVTGGNSATRSWAVDFPPADVPDGVRRAAYALCASRR
jgi:hypothetical protein